jgi:hypothetical protein
MRKKNKSGRRRRRRRRRRKRRLGRTIRANIIRKRSLSRRRRGRIIIAIDINIIKIARLMFRPQVDRVLLDRLFYILPIILSLSSYDSNIVVSIR